MRDHVLWSRVVKVRKGQPGYLRHVTRQTMKRQWEDMRSDSQQTRQPTQVMEDHLIVRMLVFLSKVTSDWKGLDQILMLLPHCCRRMLAWDESRGGSSVRDVLGFGSIHRSQSTVGSDGRILNAP